MGTRATTKRVEKGDAIEGVLVSEDYGLLETGNSQSPVAWCEERRQRQSKIQTKKRLKRYF